MGLVTLTFDLLTLKLVCESQLPSKFGHAKPLSYRIIRYVLDAVDGRTDGRTDKSNANCPLPYGQGHNNTTRRLHLISSTLMIIV